VIYTKKYGKTLLVIVSYINCHGKVVDNYDNGTISGYIRTSKKDLIKEKMI